MSPSRSPEPLASRRHGAALAAAASVLLPASILALAAPAGAQGGEPALPADEALADSGLQALAVAAGHVAPEAALEDDGRVLASATEGNIPERSLTTFDTIHVDPVVEGRSLAVGDTLLVYRDAGDLESPSTGATLGRVVYPTGIAVVRTASADIASAQIVAAFDAVVVGQGVQRLRPPPSPIPMGEQAAGEGEVVGLRDEVVIVEPLAVVFLDLPPGSAAAVGQEVELVRPASPDGPALPETVIGTARVVDVGESAATAVVTALQRSDLRVGDSYRLVRPGLGSTVPGAEGP